MSKIISLILLSLASVYAAPLNANNNTDSTLLLVKRDPCDGINASPILYHEYHEADCPAKNKLNSAGDCQGYNNIAVNCQSYCQIRTNFHYATEVPVQNTYCNGPLTCTITNTQTATYTINLGLSGGFSKGFSAGVSGGYSSATATAFATAFQVKLEAKECGYFTIVPVQKDVCGTMSSQFPITISPVPTCTGDVKSVGNMCGSQPAHNSDGNPMSATVFVQTDCVTRAPLDPSKQNPIYNQPGVPMDRGKLIDLLNGMETQFPQGPEGDSCDVSYKVVFDEFEIRGKNWAGNSLGSNGEGLEAQIKGCGALTDWSFQWTETDPTYQWYASGHLPIGVKNCVGRAVTTAGGPNANTGNCHGAG